MKVIVHKSIYRKGEKGAFFTGSLFFPETQKKMPGIILIPGSDGGIPEGLAQFIASHGYYVLALGYFGLEGLPPYLENIDLGYFQKVIEWFREVSELKENSLVLFGYSRGGELALLLGTIFPHLMNGIVAFVPSSIVCGGFPHPNRPAWLFKDQPIIPFLHGLMSSDEELSEAEDLLVACQKKVIPYHKNSENDPYDIVDLFQARQKQLEAIPIPVEKILCPILIVSGQQDKIWPSSIYGKAIMKRLDQAGSSIERLHLDYADAGHGILAPYEGSIYHPVGEFWCRLGGTVTGNKEAKEDAWKETFKFLERFFVK
jgi:dienelactone hydrolase